MTIMTNNTFSNDAERGLLLVLSGPSGVGKGTVCTALRKKMDKLVYSVSATTRQPRAGEVEGVNYFFKTKEQFQEMIAANQLLEWAEYAGNFYGTPLQFVEQTLADGRDVILEIEVQGAMQVKKQFPQGVFLFLMPPSLEELRNRIVNRGTEDDETIRRRMKLAADEIKLLEEYDYAVVNDEVERACEKIQSIITAEHLRKDRILSKIKKWMNEVNVSC
jgi:guanylate kinase